MREELTERQCGEVACVVDGNIGHNTRQPGVETECSRLHVAEQRCCGERLRHRADAEQRTGVYWFFAIGSLGSEAVSERHLTVFDERYGCCLLYTSPSPRDGLL